MCLLSNKALSLTVCTTHYGISSLGWNLVFWPPRVQESYTSLRLAYTRFARFAICFALYTILELVEVKKLNFTLDKTDPIVFCTYCWTKNHCSIVQPIFQLYIVLWTNSKQKFTLGKSNFFAIFWSYLGCPGKIWKIRIKSGKMFSSLFFT